MALSHPPGPGDPPADDRPRRPYCVPLSTRERDALARIEADLHSSDPELAARMAVRPSAAARLPRSAQAVVALAAGLLVVVIAPVLVSPGGLAVLGLTAVVMLIPWLLLRATERRDGNGEGPTLR